MIRILIVDDSAVAREHLTQVLNEAPGLQVVGQARDGAEAVAAVARLRPDLITMDINMPRMDGPTAIREIMQANPTPIVVVTGNAITAEVRATFDSLDSGALAIVPRPTFGEAGDPTPAAKLVETVRLMAEVKVVRRWNRTPAAIPSVRGVGATSTRHVLPQVVVLGASTGGPHALKEVFQALPRDFTVPLVVVQHIAAGFVEGFAAWLGDAAGRRVRIASAAEPLVAGTVYVAPEGRHLGFTAAGALWPEVPRAADSLVPSVSHTLHAAARVFGARAAGVVLTGMGRDGAEGLLALRRRGGLTFAQDAESSVVFGMPGEAVRLGAAELILPPERIGVALAGVFSSVSSPP